MKLLNYKSSLNFKLWTNQQFHSLLKILSQNHIRIIIYSRIAQFRSKIQLSPQKDQFFNRQKTEYQGYQPLSRNKNNKKFRNRSYKFQKAQRSQKAKKAFQDLQQIGAFRINNFDHSSDNSVKLYQDQKQKINDVSIKRSKTMTKQKSRSLINNRMITGKPGENLPKKESLTLKIPKTFNINSKNGQYSLNLTRVKSQNRSISNLKVALLKFSITPWQLEEQRFN